MTETRKTLKIDAANKTLGRLATEASAVLRGKHKTDFKRNVDAGDFVEVINFRSVKITGNKMEQKKYYRHSGYPGGLKELKLIDIWKRNPAEVLKKAVYGMLPKNKLRAKIIKRLIVRVD